MRKFDGPTLADIGCGAFGWHGSRQAWCLSSSHAFDGGIAAVAVEKRVSAQVDSGRTNVPLEDFLRVDGDARTTGTVRSCCLERSCKDCRANARRSVLEGSGARRTLWVLPPLLTLLKNLPVAHPGPLVLGSNRQPFPLLACSSFKTGLRAEGASSGSMSQPGTGCCSVALSPCEHLSTDAASPLPGNYRKYLQV